MTFAAPVESLNSTSTALREAEHQAPKPLKALVIQAADELDDLQRNLQDSEASLRLVKSMMEGWSNRLVAACSVRIGQMDSPSRAAEKTEAAQREVMDVARLMSELAERA